MITVDEYVSLFRNIHDRGHMTSGENALITEFTDGLGDAWTLAGDLSQAIYNRDESEINRLTEALKAYQTTGEIPLPESARPEPTLVEQPTALNVMTRLFMANIAIDDSQYESLTETYPDYQIGVSYPSGYQLKYDGLLYEVIQEHTTQADWKPSELPALYKKIISKGQIPEWVQPIGAHDAYNTGDRVKYNDHIYESLQDGNAWSPLDYPSVWKMIE